MNRKCLYCYKSLTDVEHANYHEACSLSFFGTTTPPTLNYSLDEMNELAKEVVARHVAVTGVQPKLSLSLIDDVLNKQKTKRLTVVGSLGGNYILKPPSLYYKEMPENEHLTMKMANEFGIKTVPSSLIQLKSGELSYITKRIDRKENGEKIHMLDMFQITEAVDKYKSSMERIGKAIALYASNTLLDQLRFFEVTLFCYLTGNNDMHLKNFSLLQEGLNWQLAPAYDLLNVCSINPEDKEELALTLEGKKRKLTRTDFERFGENLQLNKKQIQGVFNRFTKKKELANKLIEHSFLSKNSRAKYRAILDLRYQTLS